MKIFTLPKRILSFFIRNIIHEPIFTLRYFISLFKNDFSMKVRLHSEENFLKEIKEGKSLIRLGDGEAYLTYHGSIPGHQMFNQKLSDYFLKMLREYNDNSPYLLGIATDYITQTNKVLRLKNLLHIWLPFKILYNIEANHSAHYFDAHIFYRTGAFQKILEDELKKYKVLIVTNKKSLEVLKATELEKNFDVTFLEALGTNAFSEYNTIYNNIYSLVQENKNEWRVLLSIGPTSKALVYDLSKNGITCYDIGMGIEAIYGKSKLETMLR